MGAVSTWSDASSTVDFHCRFASGSGSGNDSPADEGSGSTDVSSGSFSHRFFFLEGL
jgi:hypothetical protein